MNIEETVRTSACAHTMARPADIIAQHAHVLPQLNESKCTLIDKYGALASGVCAVHCFLTSVAFGLFSVAGLGFLGNEITDSIFVLIAVVLGTFAVRNGYRHHRSWIPGALFATGLLMAMYSHFVLGHNHLEHHEHDAIEIEEILSTVLAVARDSANRVSFKGFQDLIEMSAQSPDKGEAKEEIEAVCKHGVEEIRFALNGRYLLDALSALKSEGICAEFEDSTRPIILRGTENEEKHYCIIMPMAIS